MSSCPAVPLEEACEGSSSEAKLLGMLSHFKIVIPWKGLLLNAWTLVACKFLIGLVAAFDTYLTIKYAESLDVYEQNPIGRWLMGLDEGPITATNQIAVFIAAKFLGTIIVLMGLEMIAAWKPRLAGIVAFPITIFQLALMGHLIFGEG